MKKLLEKLVELPALRGRGWMVSGGLPGAVLVEADGSRTELRPQARARVEQVVMETPFGRAHGLQREWIMGGVGVLCSRLFELPGVRGWVFETGFCNRSTKTLHLVELWHLKTKPGALHCEGDARGWHMGMIGHGANLGSLGEQLQSKNERETAIWAEYGMAVPHALFSDVRSTDGRWREVMEYLTLYRANGDGFLLGPVGEARGDLRHSWFVESGKCGVEAAAEMNEVAVLPGEWRWGQAMGWINEPYHRAAGLLLDWVGETHGRRPHRPVPVGWCSWYDQAARITEEHCLKVAGALEKLQPRLRFSVFQLDDGYQRQVGDWRTNEKFPDGLGRFVGAAGKMGCSPGIWMAPLAVHESLGWHRKHPEWFQRDRSGALINHAGNWGGKSYFLDPTHPAVEKRIERMILEKKAEGFTYFKIDFNDLSRRCRFYDGKSTRLQAFRRLYALYRKTLGEEIYLLACAGFTRGVLGFADGGRVGPDSVATWRRVAPCNLKECIRAVGMTAVAHGRWMSNDPDVTYMKVDWDKCREHQWRVWHSFVGLLGGLVLTSDRFFDLGQKGVEKSRLRNLEVILPPVREAGRSYRAAWDEEHEVFGIRVDRPWGSHHALLVWNSDSETSRKLSLGRDELGLDEVDHAVWSFWESEFLGIWKRRVGAFSTKLQPEHGRVLRFTPLRTDGVPQIVGSSLHIGMGSREFEMVRAGEGVLEIQFSQDGAMDGVVAIYSKQPLRMEQTCGARFQFEAGSEPGIWRLRIKRRAGATGLVRLVQVENSSC